MTDQTDMQGSQTQVNPLTLYNSLTRKKEVFVPQDPSRVTMYNCGPTVYSYAHIGNARAAVVADVLFRVLRHIYGEDHVVYARNITDVDDKIIQSAKEQGVDISVITEKYARIYNEDLAAIGCLPPTHQPKATNNIGGMINIIQALLKDGYAYESDGHVFFDVSKYEGYGKLSGNTLDALRGGDRVGEGEVARKKNSADFVLWKPEMDGVGWEAPFGRGRPGWHIECSAMAKETLGETIDIHCGGVDLKFPHHENEIAQSECAHGKTMAKYWVHNEFLNMGREKMSKSLGNVKLINDLLKDWDGEVIRLALLKAHYRSELVWTEDLLKESKAQLDKWYREIEKLGLRVDFRASKPSELFVNKISADIQTIDAITYVEALRKALYLDIASNINTVFEVSDTGNFDLLDPAGLSLLLRRVSDFQGNANLLGLLQKDPVEWFKGGASEDEETQFDAIAQKRATARAEKNWGDADAARDEAKALGIVLEDNPDGTTTWRRA